MDIATWSVRRQRHHGWTAQMAGYGSSSPSRSMRAALTTAKLRALLRGSESGGLYVLVANSIYLRRRLLRYLRPRCRCHCSALPPTCHHSVVRTRGANFSYNCQLCGAHFGIDWVLRLARLWHTVLTMASALGDLGQPELMRRSTLEISHRYPRWYRFRGFSHPERRRVHKATSLPSPAAPRKRRAKSPSQCVTPFRPG